MKHFQWKLLLPHAVAIIIFLLIAIIFCKPALNGKVLQQSDVTHWKGMAQDLFRYKETHGHYPLWNNNLFSGMPAYQIALEAENPISIGYLHILFTLDLWKPIGFFFLLCISFYFLSQVVNVNPYIGIVGSLAYAYASFDPVIIVAGHDTQMQALGYLPALLAAIWLLYHKKYWWGTALTAVFSALLIQQNHLQITYYFLIIAVVMTIGFLVQWIQSKQYKHALKAIALAAIAGGLGAACNLVNLATTYDYSKETMRNGSALLDTTSANKKTDVTKAGLPIDYAFAWSYGKLETYTLLIPGIYGGSGGNEIHANSNFGKLATEKGLQEDQAENFAASMPAYWGPQQLGTSGPVYLGAIICFLFIVGMFYLKTPNKWWLLALSVLAIAMSWGKNFEPFNEFLFNHLPMYNKFRVPTMTLIIPQLIFPFTAILTLQQFFFEETDKQQSIKKIRQSVIVTILLFVIAAYLYFSFNYVGSTDENLKKYLSKAVGGEETGNSFYKALLQDRQSLFGSDIVRSITFITLAIVVLWLFIIEKLKANYAIIALLFLSTIDVLGVGRRYLNENNFQDEETINDESFKPTPADAAILKDSSYYRVLNFTVDPFNDALTSYYHHSIGGYHPAKLSIYEDLLNFHLRKQPINFKVLDMLNTKYFIVANPQTNQPMAQQNPQALGTAWFVKGIQYEKNPLSVIKALNNFNPKDTAVIEEKDKSLIHISNETDTAAFVHLIKNENDFIEYQSQSNNNEFAVFSEIFYNRGWKAYIDNKETPIIQTNYVLRGLSIPSGKHTITFEFKPAAYYSSNKVAVISSAIVWLLLLGAIATGFKKPKVENS